MRPVDGVAAYKKTCVVVWLPRLKNPKLYACVLPGARGVATSAPDSDSTLAHTSSGNQTERRFLARVRLAQLWVRATNSGAALLHHGELGTARASELPLALFDVNSGHMPAISV